MNHFNNNIQYIIIENDYFDIKKISKIKNIFPNIKYFINEYTSIPTKTEKNSNDIIHQFNPTDENENQTENNIIIEIDFNEFDDEINMNYKPPIMEQIKSEPDESNIELIKTFNEQFVSDENKLIKNITKKEIINYDDFTYNFKSNKKEEIPKKEEIKKKEENDTTIPENIKDDSFEMFDMINKSKQTLEEQKMFQMFQNLLLRCLFNAELKLTTKPKNSLILN